MPRSVKESEDELEMKTVGRRTRAIGGTPIVDSPLRRSARNKQPVSQDGSLPDSITLVSDAAVPPARSTRRRSAVIDHSTTENTISLRSRKNSTASDTIEFTDNDTLGDGKKRITTRSTATTPSIETPTKSRLRRTSRAGSESKTMSPLRTTRRTRASSMDLEDLDVQSKPFNRMSTMPNELSVIKEINILKDNQQNNRFDTEIMNVANDSPMNNIKSLMSRLNDNENEVNMQVKMKVTSTEVSEQLCNNVFESPTKNPSTTLTKSKTDLELSNKILQKLDFPKVVLHKSDVSTLKSPGNKESGESNKNVPDKQSKSNAPRRHSDNVTNSMIIQVEKGLNKSVDDRLLITDESQALSTLSSSSDFATLRQSETINNNTSFNNEDLLSVANDSKDETIYLDSPCGQKMVEKPKNVSENFQEKDSVLEVDTTIENPVFDDSINMNSSQRKSLIENKDHDNFNSTETHVYENSVENSHESLSLCKENTDENVESNNLSVVILDTDNSEDSKNTTVKSYDNVAEIRRLSVAKTPEHNEENEEINATTRWSLSTESISTSRPSQIRKSQGELDSDTKERNVDSSEDIETDVENLFQDISAEEWKAKQTQSLENDGNNEDMKFENVRSSDNESSNKNNSIIEKITYTVDNNSRGISNKSTKSNSRKSLNTESVKSKSDNKLKRRTIERMDTTKSCTKHESVPKEKNIIDISEDETDDQNKTEYSLKSPEESLQQSLTEQIQDKIPKEHLMNEETGSENETTPANESLHNTSININNTSDDNSDSMDSDIANELNLKGDSISLYSDDNIPGDECRASETETSEDDNDDDADDMADFIVDDEEIEKEESDEESNSEDNEESNSENDTSIKKSSIQEVHKAYESDDEQDISLKMKSGIDNSSSDKNECDMELNKTPDTAEINISQEYETKKLNSIPSTDARTPKSLWRLSSSTVATPPKLPSTEITADLKTSILNKSQNKIAPRPQKNINNSRKCQLKDMSDTPFNQSMQTAPTVSPEVTYLMKEKLNESLPALKLQRRSLKASHTLASVQETTPKIKKQKVTVCDDVDTDVEKSHKKRSKKLSEVSTLAMETDDLPHTIKEDHSINSAALMKNIKKGHALMRNEEKCCVKSVEMSDTSIKSSLKRLPADVLENLPDAPINKRRKIEQTHVHSKTTFDSKNSQSNNSAHTSASTCNSTTKFEVISLKSTLAKLKNLANGQKKMKKQRRIENMFVPSKFSSTTHFDVVSLKKRTKKRSKKNAAALSFRERMLARNKIQPVSAYLMYQQKKKSSSYTQH